jgi:hypothetical protein
MAFYIAIEGFKIPDSIQYISYYAFADLKLERVGSSSYLGNWLIRIGSDGHYFTKPNTVGIASYAIRWSGGDIVIPKSVKYISTSALKKEAY